MCGATALVFPSRYGGFGLPSLEALAVGAPAIVPDIPSGREVCGNIPNTSRQTVESNWLKSCWKRLLFPHKSGDSPVKPGGHMPDNSLGRMLQQQRRRC